MLSGVSASKDLTSRRAEARAKHKSRSVLIVHVLSAGSLQHPSAVTNMHLAPWHWPGAQGPGRSRSRDHPSDVSTAKGGGGGGWRLLAAVVNMRQPHQPWRSAASDMGDGMAF